MLEPCFRPYDTGTCIINLPYKFCCCLIRVLLALRMSLVDYHSDSSTGEAQDGSTAGGDAAGTSVSVVPSQRLLLPAAFRGIPAVDSRGKVKTFDIPGGCFACAIFMEVPNSPAIVAMCEAAFSALFERRGCFRVGAPPELPPHMSLSRCFVLGGHQTNRLLECVRRAFSGTRTFDVSLDGSRVFENDERTRSFLSLLVNAGRSAVEGLIAIADGVMTEFSKPLFYEVSLRGGCRVPSSFLLACFNS